MKSRMNLLAMVAALTVALVSATVARATTIEIGLQETGVNGGAITTETTTSSGNATISGVTYGTFTVNNVSATGAPILASGDLDSNSLNVSSSTGGTLYVWVTITGLTSPTGTTNFLSSLTSNSLPSGWTATLVTYEDSSNAAYGTGTTLASNTFTGIGTKVLTNPATLASPYSLTEEYEITSTGSGTANDTVDLSTAPEPATLSLLGIALLGLVGLGKKEFA